MRSLPSDERLASNLDVSVEALKKCELWSLFQIAPVKVERDVLSCHSNSGEETYAKGCRVIDRISILPTHLRIENPTDVLDGWILTVLVESLSRVREEGDVLP